MLKVSNYSDDDRVEIELNIPTTDLRYFEIQNGLDALSLITVCLSRHDAEMLATLIRAALPAHSSTP